MSPQCFANQQSKTSGQAEHGTQNPDSEQQTTDKKENDFMFVFLADVLSNLRDVSHNWLGGSKNLQNSCFSPKEGFSSFGSIFVPLS